TPVTTVAPVRLATPAEAHLWDGVQGGPFSPYDDGIATGWGRDGSGGLPSRLQFVGVYITPPAPDNLGIKRIMVDRGPCQGDSGSPLLVRSGGVLVQAGVLKGASCTGAASYSEVGAGTNRTWLFGQLTALPYTHFGTTDWDRDGHQDIVAREDVTGTLWLYLGDSRRAVPNAPRVQIGNGWRGYSPVGVADWDRDGYPDILTRNDGTGDLWLYPGDGRRGYSQAVPVRIGTGWAGHTPLGVADWDRDGNPDVVARQDSTGELWLHPGTGTRGVPGTTRVLLGWGWNSFTSFGVTDWDRDGHRDVVARDNATGTLWLYPGDSRRGVPTVGRVQIGNGWAGFSPFGAVDWDRDGHQDILARHDATGDMWLYPGQSVRGYPNVARAQLGWGW
ncbi:trypsin-like serine protease, partial [Micromonospora fluostatini]